MSILKITSKIMFAKLMPLYHFSRFKREEIVVCGCVCVCVCI